MNILRAVMLALEEEAENLAGLHKQMQHLDAASAGRHCVVMAALTELQRKVNTMSDTQASLDTAIASLIADNATLKAAVEGAPAAIATLVANAIAKQVTVGVTPAQLQSLAELHTALGGEATQLQQALAGTAPQLPVVTPPGTPPVPVTTPAPAPAPAPGTINPATGLPV